MLILLHLFLFSNETKYGYTPLKRFFDLVVLDPYGQIDFITLGNQAAAALEEEVGFYCIQDVYKTRTPRIST